ncbi:MAG TPA: type II toxin-antitoxin system HipA family toxin [Verrucomicrobia bacterium]|nr:type II toxin-antitoxin system HipA family toxin [Verrucomicrobiota bacterium]
MYKPVNLVEVWIWGARVGAVAKDPRTGFYAFEYDPRFVRTGIELAPLFMPIRRANQPFVFPDLPEESYHRLPALLADALPDSFGNILIDAWMAEQGIERSRISVLDRLAYMGKRSMGALEFKPVIGPKEKTPTAIELSSLVESARRAVYGDLGIDARTDAALHQLMQVGTSAGGARAKAVIGWDRKNRKLCSGQFDVPDGFEHWIIKFDGVGDTPNATQDSGRVELAYHNMARAAGITMMECDLFCHDGRAHFMTRRFDRDGNTRHHLQTLCAMAHLSFHQRAAYSYHQLFETVNELGMDYATREEVFRRMAFNVLARNTDDHSKNVSFLLKQGGGWELAPAYDLTYSYTQVGEWNEWANPRVMAVSGKFSNITAKDLLEVAEQFGIGTARRELDRVMDAVRRWPTFADAASVTDENVIQALI